MALSLVTNGSAVELPYGRDVQTGEIIHTYEGLLLWSEDERNAVGVFTIEESEEIPADCLVVSSSLEVDEGTVRRVIECEPIPLADLKSRALAALANARWQVCQTFTYDGVIAPADTALVAVTGYVVAAQIIAPDGPQTWKLASGEFRQWTVADVINYGVAIRGHIQSAFDLEGERAGLIEAAETAEELASVPVTTGWPT